MRCRERKEKFTKKRWKLKKEVENQTSKKSSLNDQLKKQQQNQRLLAKEKSVFWRIGEAWIRPKDLMFYCRDTGNKHLWNLWRKKNARRNYVYLCVSKVNPKQKNQSSLSKTIIFAWVCEVAENSANFAAISRGRA